MKDGYLKVSLKKIHRKIPIIERARKLPKKSGIWWNAFPNRERPGNVLGTALSYGRYCITLELVMSQRLNP